MVAVQPLSSLPRTWFRLAVGELGPFRSTLSASGEFDLCARGALADVLQQQLDAGRRFVCLDLSGVTFMDCSCLGVLELFHHRFHELHGLLDLAATSPQVARLISLAGLQDCLFVAPDHRVPFRSVETAGTGTFSSVLP
jgi:anti-anti-sigma factor